MEITNQNVNAGYLGWVRVHAIICLDLQGYVLRAEQFECCSEMLTVGFCVFFEWICMKMRGFSQRVKVSFCAFYIAFLSDGNAAAC